MICAAADLHGELPDVPPCDLLLLAGDIAPYEVERDDARCAEWFATEFTAWLAAIPAAEVIGIAGNHDFWAPAIGAGAHARLFGAPWTYLQDAEVTTAGGLRVYGSPWTRDEYDTAFEAPAAELERHFAQIPDGLDVLIAHSPPLGHGDTLADDAGQIQMGSAELLGAIRRARPRLVVYGHAHQGYGFRGEDPPGTVLANVTLRTDYTGGLHRVSQI